MRWRLTGTVAYADNVRRPWQTVPSLTQLLVQVDAVYPVRHAADGTAAGQGHFNVNPKSDHTPDVNGDVRAGDIGEVVEDDAFTVAEAIRLSRDPRIKYVIHERRLFSSYDHTDGPPYTWRPYSGSNPHSSHVHISVLRSNQNDDSTWDIGDDDMAVSDWAQASWDWAKARFSWSSGPKDLVTVEQLMVFLKRYDASVGPVDSGVTEEQVATAIDTHAANPDAHHA